MKKAYRGGKQDCGRIFDFEPDYPAIALGSQPEVPYPAGEKAESDPDISGAKRLAI
jgi:hypothetical protein